MYSSIDKLLRTTLRTLARDETLAALGDMDPQIERTRDARHGDFTSNVAMRAAKALGEKPRDIATRIVEAMSASALIARVEIAGPGFINFTLTQSAWHQAVAETFARGTEYGTSTSGDGKKALVEFVSANPTGPLHVGHGRHAAFGACLANLLRATGYEVDTEYYVNDAGRQMNILALSVWLRYLQLGDVAPEFPGKCYQADYCRDIAAEIKGSHGDVFMSGAAAVVELLNTPVDDEETQLDALIELAQNSLEADGFAVFFDAAIETILADIRDDLVQGRRIAAYVVRRQ